MPGITVKYKASTLIEVLVAMVIILVCAGLGITAFSNLHRDMNGNKQSQAEVYMAKIQNDTKIDSDFTDKDFEFAGLHFERSVLPYNKDKRIRLLRIEAFNNLDRKIGEIKELIMVTP
jgi:prepilin-type N-terminal cleavage/methylation domain-containing protein